MKERLEKIEKKMQEKIMARFGTLEDSCSACNAAIKKMLEEEGLEIVRILVLDENGEDIHEFCTVDGIGFDPTRSQFEDGELDEMEQVEAEWPFGDRYYEEGAWLTVEEEN